MAKGLNSSEIQKGFEKLNDNPFWNMYRERLGQEYQRVENALVTNAGADADQLRVCASLMSAFRTAIHLPTLLVQEANSQEEIERLEEDG